MQAQVQVVGGAVDLRKDRRGQDGWAHWNVETEPGLGRGALWWLLHFCLGGWEDGAPLRGVGLGGPAIHF